MPDSIKENKSDIFNSSSDFVHVTDKELANKKRIFNLLNDNIFVGIGQLFFPLAKKLNIPVKHVVKPFYEYFCGGETIEKCRKIINDLQKHNIKTILDYGVEGANSDKIFQITHDEIVNNIHFAKSSLSIPVVSIKLTGLVNKELLEKISSKKNLNESEKKQLTRFENRLDIICYQAMICNIQVYIDAEESWIQDAIDGLVENLMRIYNKDKVVVFTTLQMYRWGRLKYLNEIFKDAAKFNYKIGVKLVRGAYLETEHKISKAKNELPIVFQKKQDTDKSYNEALKFCIEHLERIYLCSATHNEESNLYLIELMKINGITNDDERVYFSQLYGMSDHITYGLAKENYNTAKFLPYGPVDAVMPYLMRRAQENTAIQGQMGRELNRVVKEIVRRRQNKSLLNSKA